MKKVILILWRIVCFSGIVWFGLGLAGEYYVYRKYLHPQVDFIFAGDDKTMLLLAGLLWFFVVIKNLTLMNQVDHVGIFTWMLPYRASDSISSDTYRKRQAQHPRIPDKYLSERPNGLVLGKIKKKFVRIPIKSGSCKNACLIGTPGSGKSVLLLTMLIYYINLAKKFKDEAMTFFVLDVKPELANKSCFIKSSQNVKVMNPRKKTTYGWNPYYNIKEDTSDDDIMHELSVISEALISNKNEKNEFFYKSARNIMKAILFYTIKQGMTFMEGIDYLMCESISAVVGRTIDACGDDSELRRTRNLLTPYRDKDGEAFQGIELAFREGLDIFQTDTVNWFLNLNPKKASPEDLENEISIFFSMPEDMLDEYNMLLKLVTAQVVAHCTRRPEDSNMITLVIDEAARCGKINWTSFLSTSRSRQVSTILAFQGLSQIRKVWGKDDADSLISLCQIISILSCADTGTAKELATWAGDYMEEKHSISSKGTDDNGNSRSYDTKSILQPSDFMTILENKEALLFIEGRYYRPSIEEARYYNVPELNEISKQCVEANRS